MRTLGAALALLGGGGILAAFGQPKPTLVVVGGDTLGYLSPCGCTKPMIGGIKRRMTLSRQLTAGRKSLILENGGLVNGNQRQDLLKGEALAEILASAGVDAVAFTPRERGLGPGGMMSLLNFGAGMWVDSQSSGEAANQPQPVIEADGFRIFSLSPDANPPTLPGESRQPWNESLAVLRQANRDATASLVLLCAGDLNDAKQAIAAWPELDIVVYRSQGLPQKPIRMGTTWALSPADHGKYLVAFDWNGSQLSNYRRLPLRADIPDDQSTSKTYADYLKRVTREGLLLNLPRLASKPFAGNKVCGSCHPAAERTWRQSQHSQAVATLQEEGHHRDPDCVGCHVVGLNFQGGFRSEVETPQLKNVGCESCHGAGKDHALSPYKVNMPTMGAKACLPCHTPDHSPNFQYNLYWQKIKH